MTEYQMVLIVEGRDVNIPVLPEKIGVSSPGRNERVTLLGVGEALLLREKGLRMISWESFFPASGAPYVSGASEAPDDVIEIIQRARDTKKPVRFLLLGTNLSCNLRVGVESFEYEERAGEVGDIYYTIKLCEWKDISPKRVVLSGEGSVSLIEPQRTGSPEALPQTYTVRDGDSLWLIAQMFYGKGGEYLRIYDSNIEIIGSNPSLIYAGQVLKIPQ